MAFRFVHAADIHLDSPLLSLDEYPGAPVEEIRLATRLPGTSDTMRLFKSRIAELELYRIIQSTTRRGLPGWPGLSWVIR
jgi:hypothetical protein